MDINYLIGHNGDNKRILFFFLILYNLFVLNYHIFVGKCIFFYQREGSRHGFCVVFFVVAFLADC